MQTEDWIERTLLVVSGTGNMCQPSLHYMLARGGNVADSKKIYP